MNPENREAEAEELLASIEAGCSLSENPLTFAKRRARLMELVRKGLEGEKRVKMKCARCYEPQEHGWHKPVSHGGLDIHYVWPHHQFEPNMTGYSTFDPAAQPTSGDTAKEPRIPIMSMREIMEAEEPTTHMPRATKEQARSFLRKYANGPLDCLYCGVIHSAFCPKEEALIDSMVAFANSISPSMTASAKCRSQIISELCADNSISWHETVAKAYDAGLIGATDQAHEWDKAVRTLKWVRSYAIEQNLAALQIKVEHSLAALAALSGERK